MVLNQDGIFSRAEQATNKYGQAKARETLELALSDAQIKKYESGLTDKELDNKIAEIEGELLPKEKPNKNLQNVIVDGYIFEIDRSVPKIVDYIGPADGVIITAMITGNDGWIKPGETISVSGVIKTYSGGTITNVSATKGEIAIPGFSIDGEGKYIINDITEDTEITIKAEDSYKKSNSKNIPITIRIDNIDPTLSDVTATAEARKIKIKAVAIDNESGLKQINYSIEPDTIVDGKAKGTFMSGQEITLTATTSEEYTIIFIAEDNVGNKSEEQSKTVRTQGVIKHIKTPTGLKEVNTLEIYGATVTGYTCPRDSITDLTVNHPGWQIFYIDEEDDHRVYLIADDYVVPPVNNATTKLLVGGNSYYTKAYRFGTNVSDTIILGKFTGNIPDTSFTRKFLSDYKGEKASTPSLQATNYMLDQEIWSEFIGEKATYAFGGATLPLLSVSHNDIFSSKLKLSVIGCGYSFSCEPNYPGWTNGLNIVDQSNSAKSSYLSRIWFGGS